MHPSTGASRVFPNHTTRSLFPGCSPSVSAFNCNITWHYDKQINRTPTFHGFKNRLTNDVWSSSQILWNTLVSNALPSSFRLSDIFQPFDESGLSTRPATANPLTNAIHFLILPAAFAPAGLGDCRRTITTVRTEANEDKVISTTWQSIDGLRSRQETLGVAKPSTATRTKPLNGASSATQTNPDGTSVETATSILANGNTQTTSIFKDTSSSILQTSTMVSDALGRTLQTTNGRGHVTQYAYHLHTPQPPEQGPATIGQTASVTQVNAAPGSTPGNLVTQYTYTLTLGSGRVIETTLPDTSKQGRAIGRRAIGHPLKS
jgi:hypothetical protein